MIAPLFACPHARVSHCAADHWPVTVRRLGTHSFRSLHAARQAFADVDVCPCLRAYFESRECVEFVPPIVHGIAHLASLDLRGAAGKGAA